MGAVVVATLVNVIDLSPDDAGLAVLLYVFVAAVYFAHFLVRHGDEIPTRSDRP